MSRTPRHLAAIALTAAALFAPSLAAAASFDCSKATAPREKLICGDPTLSDLDTRLGKTYEERKARLSPHGADLLQTSERSWLHFAATICPLDLPADAIKMDARRDPKTASKSYMRIV